MMDVVDDHLSVVLLAPFLHVPVVEPLVVGWDEVNPLKDLERLLSRTCPLRNHDIGADPGRQRPRPHGFDEFTATSGVSSHTALPFRRPSAAQGPW